MTSSESLTLLETTSFSVRWGQSCALFQGWHTDPELGIYYPFRNWSTFSVGWGWSCARCRVGEGSLSLVYMAASSIDPAWSSCPFPCAIKIAALGWPGAGGPVLEGKWLKPDQWQQNEEWHLLRQSQHCFKKCLCRRDWFSCVFSYFSAWYNLLWAKLEDLSLGLLQSI